jgi:DNA polymerase-3 subunit epsilon
MIALDFETTGLDVKRDHILAAGWVLIRGDRIVISSAREIRVRDESEKGVGQSAVIHGILDSDLVDGETNESLVEQLLAELAGRAIVAHAAMIERGFLNTLLRRLGGTALTNPFIDTMTVEKLLIAGQGGGAGEMQGQLTLAASRARHGLPDHQQHSAASDALATAELFLAQVAALGGAEKLKLRDVR